MPPKIKAAISDRTTFNTDEEPILCFYKNSDKYWVLTTERIILSYDSIENIYLNDIQNIELYKLFNESTNKLHINTIQLEINNKLFDLEVEERTWHVIFNMLKFMLNK